MSADHISASMQALSSTGLISQKDTSTAHALFDARMSVPRLVASLAPADVATVFKCAADKHNVNILLPHYGLFYGEFCAGYTMNNSAKAHMIASAAAHTIHTNAPAAAGGNGVARSQAKRRHRPPKKLSPPSSQQRLCSQEEKKTENTSAFLVDAENVLPTADADVERTGTKNSRRRRRTLSSSGTTTAASTTVSVFEAKKDDDALYQGLLGSATHTTTDAFASQESVGAKRKRRSRFRPPTTIVGVACANTK